MDSVSPRLVLFGFLAQCEAGRYARGFINGRYTTVQSGSLRAEIFRRTRQRYYSTLRCYLSRGAGRLLHTASIQHHQIGFGKEHPEDSESDNRYSRAATTLKKWMDEGILVQETKPSLVIYQMEFDQAVLGHRVIDGIVCLVRVDDYGEGKVLPHEKTYKGPKQDQLNLLRSCRANFTPIHSLFSDEPNLVSREYAAYIQRSPDQEVREPDGTVHRTWNIYEEEVIHRITQLIEQKSLFIADGHHRYETALAYRAEMRAAGQSDPSAPHEFVMMYLTSMSHPGLTILPAHRVVKGLQDLDVPRMLRLIEPYFHIEEVPFSGGDRGSVFRAMLDRIVSYLEIGGKFGMMVHGESCFRLLKLKDFDRAESLMDQQIPAPLRSLDVTILREIIMNYGLGMDSENAEGKIGYTPHCGDALRKVIEGEAQIGFILNPTRVDQVRKAAELGHKLPQKSTYFYPKISSGLVLRVF